uniref:Putative secreted protein n=1 Tax=Anopheles darlingi TaxID=43151 RepID=A0A2M4D377_ANODA
MALRTVLISYGQVEAIFLAFSVHSAAATTATQFLRNPLITHCLPSVFCSLLPSEQFNRMDGNEEPATHRQAHIFAAAPAAAAAAAEAASVVFPHIWSIFLINLLLPTVVATMDGNRFHFCSLFSFSQGPRWACFWSAAEAAATAGRDDASCRNGALCIILAQPAYIVLYRPQALRSRVSKRCFDFCSTIPTQEGGITFIWPAHRVESSCSFHAWISYKQRDLIFHHVGHICS